VKACAAKGENRLTAFWKKETVHGNRKHKGCYVTIRRRAIVFIKIEYVLFSVCSLQQLTAITFYGQKR